MILKLIGVVILVLLGLILLAVLSVLLVPVRYSLSGCYKDQVKAEVRVTWLLHLVSIKVLYEDQMDITVRLLGKRLFSLKESSEEAKGSLKELAEETEEELAEFWEEGTEPGDWGEIPEQEQDREPDLVEEPGEKEREGPDSKDDSRDREEDADFRESRKPKGSPSVSSRIKSIKAKWDQVLSYKETGIAFLQNEENQKTIKLILRQCRAFIRHILPGKIRGRAVLGFEDPSVTGSVLAGLGILYAWYGDAVEIVPVFDEKILEAEGSLKGRIRAGTLLAFAIRVLLNKNFRLLVTRWRRKGGIERGRE